jgi:hypothetical protein
LLAVLRLGFQSVMVTFQLLGAIMLLKAHAFLPLQLQFRAAGLLSSLGAFLLRHLSGTLHAIGASTFDT